MTDEEFKEYMMNEITNERVFSGLDIARFHGGLDYVYKESIKAGFLKDVDAMKYIIKNKIPIPGF